MKAASIGIFLLLLAIVVAIFGQVLELRPFESDNLYVLQWANNAHPRDLLRGDPLVYPEWRPLAHATIWLQYRWATIDHLWTYYSVNILLWVACGWVMCRIVQRLSGSPAAGIVSTVVLLTSPILIDSVVLIEERQSSLACLFGLTAWLLIIRAGNRLPTRAELFGEFLLLLAAALSKEYGLAFAGAVAVYAFYDRLWALGWSATAAAGVYIGLRFGFAGAALARFCEDHGYFFAVRSVCFDKFDVVTGTQAAYNVVATAVGSLLPGLLADNGEIVISPRWLMMSALLLALAVLGWAKGPKPTRMGILVVAFNAALCFLLFRSRNHVVALCAVSIAVGVGFAIAANAADRFKLSPLTRTLAIALLLGVSLTRAGVTREFMSDRVEASSRPDPCLDGVRSPDRAFIRRVWARYDMPIPVCIRSAQPD